MTGFRWRKSSSKQFFYADILNFAGFELEQADLPFVSGHSVSEHLQYCVGKYCPDKTVE